MSDFGDFEKLINASDLIEWIMETYPDWCEGTVRGIVDHIDEMPSIQPTIEERKTGHWILYENQRQEDVENGNYLYICSECGKSDLHAKTQEVPFCWWCGAKME